MQYCTFELNEESQELCIIITPFGKYKYKRFLIGIKCAPDFAQQAMENILWGINDTEVYLDDIVCFSNDWEHQIKLLDQVLRELQASRLTINPQKCE